MALGTHAVINLDKVMAAYHGNLESMQASVSLDNGSVVINSFNLVSGETGVFEAAAPATATLASAEILLVASPEITYLAGQTMKDFYNPAGSTFRAYHLHAGDQFTVSTEAIAGGAAVAVGSYVVPQNGSYQLLAQTAAPTPTAVSFYGVIVASTYLGAYQDPAVTIKVVQSNA